MTIFLLRIFFTTQNVLIINILRRNLYYAIVSVTRAYKYDRFFRTCACQTCIDTDHFFVLFNFSNLYKTAYTYVCDFGYIFLLRVCSHEAVLTRGCAAARGRALSRGEMRQRAHTRVRETAYARRRASTIRFAAF